MPRLEPRLSVRAIRPLVSALKTLGHDADAIARTAGLAPVLLESPDARVPMCVGVSLLTHAVEQTGDSNVGLHLAERADPSSFDVHYYAMLASATLGDAYERLCRYQRLIHESSHVELTIEHDRAVLRHWLPGGTAAPRQTAEFLAASWVRAGRLVTAIEWSPLEVHFVHSTPINPADHVRFFNCPVYFGSGDTAVVMPADLLDAPCSRGDHALLRLLDRYAADRLEQSPRVHSVAERTRSALGDQLSGRDPDVSSIARQLRMSARSLTRHLASEGRRTEGFSNRFDVKRPFGILPTPTFPSRKSRSCSDSPSSAPFIAPSTAGPAARPPHSVETWRNRPILLAGSVNTLAPPVPSTGTGGRDEFSAMDTHARR